MVNKNQVNSVKQEEISNQSQTTSTYNLNEFDKSLLVEKVATVSLPKTTYQKLDQMTGISLNDIFQGLTKEDIQNFKEISNIQGKSDRGEPFKSFISENGEGNFIVTPNKVIETHKENDENYDYTETRKNGRGRRKVNIHTVNGISTICITNIGSDISAKDSRECDTFASFFRQPRNGMNIEMKNMDNEERALYMLELQRLGIKPQDDTQNTFSKMTPEQLEMAKAKGIYLRTHASVKIEKQEGKVFKKIVSMQYADNEDAPRAIWIVSQNGIRQQPEGKMYRKASNGRYIDSSSITFVDRKPKYNLFDFQDILAQLENGMINENIISLIREKVKELGGKLPKEVEMIQDRIENQPSIGLETPEYEEDFMPGFSTLGRM